MWSEFESLEIETHSLNLSRFSSFFYGKKSILKFIQKTSPDLVHTQGLRADGFLASLALDTPWVMTSRNFPQDDYPTKFGKVRGALMVRQHLSAMRRCSNLVACSKTIQSKLAHIGISSIAIQNGVKMLKGDSSLVPLYTNIPRPIYISVGSLIPRKNMKLLIEAFGQMPDNHRGSLVILGDGPLRVDLEQNSFQDVHIVGNVSNVPDYLAGADYFVSSSLSEGLPNTVLEALMLGLPVILSDIESHREIAEESSSACKVFALGGGVKGLSTMLSDASQLFDKDSAENARRLAQHKLSAERMSNNYQRLYKSILERK